jgi:hypothetical protein
MFITANIIFNLLNHMVHDEYIYTRRSPGKGA